MYPIPSTAELPLANVPGAVLDPAAAGAASGGRPALPADGVDVRGRAGMNAVPAGDGSWAGGGDNAAQGGFLGVIDGIIATIGSLLGQYTAALGAEGVGRQTVTDGVFASTGDPHLSEHATVVTPAGTASPVDVRFDSMTGHENLLSAHDIGGGYRLSTTVTAADANGVTFNAGATVHLNGDLDAISLAADGTSSVIGGGTPIAVAAGRTLTLDGGESVTRNADGSLVVAASNVNGGSIVTTLSAVGGGVNVSATVHNATVGGDIAAGSAGGAPPVVMPPARVSLGGVLGADSSGVPGSRLAPFVER